MASLFPSCKASR